MILKCERGIIFYLVLTLSACITSENQGHRLGAGVFEGRYTENTLESFNATLSEDFIKRKEFKYYELDIRETSDGELILFHDRYFSRRLLANSESNRNILAQSDSSFLKRNRVRNYPLSVIKELQLKNGETIPTLREFLKSAEQNRIKERIFVELKEPLTRAGMDSLFYLLSLYRFELSLSVLMYPSVFRAINREHSDIVELLYNKQIYFYEVRKPKSRQFIYDL